MKIKILLLLILTSCFCTAQNNILKTNLSGLAIKNYNILYERAFTRLFSFSIGLRHMKQANVPLKSQIEKMVDNSDLKVNEFRLGNTAITGEGRLYLGLRKLRGFYIAPYIRYSSFKMSMPIKNPNNTTGAPIVFNGEINGTSAGLLFGVQHCLLKKLVLDFWILGGHYGNSTGTLKATDIPAMTTTEQQNLQNKLDEFKNIGPFKTRSNVTSTTTAEMTTAGPWLGLRSLALTIGYRF